MKQRTYGEAAKQYAETLIQRGVDYDEILKEPTLKQIPRATLRLWKSRLVSKVETPETANDTPMKRADETPEQMEETPLSVQETTVLQQFVKTALQTFHPADLVFYSTVAIGGLGVAQALQGVGIAVSVLWFAVAAIYLHRLKMYARWGDALVLAVIELAVGIPAHYTWATNSLWANIKHLPLTVYVEKYQNAAGEWVAFYAGKDIEMPFYIACYVAAILAIFGACAVAASVLANKKNESLTASKGA